MTDRELKKLSRTELLELLLVQTKEVERLQGELDQAEALLHKRNLEIQQSGNIAEAALKINGVFEAAQAAAEQYLDNVRFLEQSTLTRCSQMEQETKEKCQRFVSQAEEEAKNFWLKIREDIRQPYLEHERWLQIDSALNGKLYQKIEF